MILPTKHISTEYSLLGVGAKILEQLDSNYTVTNLWERVRNFPEIKAYWKFILALDLLFMMGVLDLKEGLLIRVET